MLSGAAARLCGAAAAHKLPGVNRESVAQLATDVAQTALGPLAGSTSRQAVSSSAALRSAGDRHAYFNVPMLLGLFASLSKPTLEQREEVAAKGLRRGHNYDEVMCTLPDAASTVRMPRGPLWAVDNKRVKVGSGKKVYQAGRQLLQRWGHFQLSWAEVSSATRVKAGEPVCVVAKTLFLWMANPLKILYAAEERVPRRELPGGGRSAPLQRFHFGQGCLHGHSLAGEEAFRLEWDKSDDSVWFEIYTVSRPAHPVSVLTYPLVRYYQSRFKEECAALVTSELMS